MVPKNVQEGLWAIGHLQCRVQCILYTVCVVCTVYKILIPCWSMCAIVHMSLFVVSSNVQRGFCCLCGCRERPRFLYCILIFGFCVVRLGHVLLINESCTVHLGPLKYVD